MTNKKPTLASRASTAHITYVDAVMRILPATGMRTAMDALPFAGFRMRLRNKSPRAVSAAWPAGNTQVLSEAWDAITGMVKEHPDLEEFQDLVLVAVQREEVWFGEQVGGRAVYERVGRAWDGWVNAEYVAEGSLRVVLEVVVGGRNEVEGIEKRREEEQEEMEGVSEDEHEHRAKRRKA